MGSPFLYENDPHPGGYGSLKAQTPASYDVGVIQRDYSIALSLTVIALFL